MEIAKYRQGKAVKSKRDVVKYFSDDKLITEFQRQCLTSQIFGDFQRPDFPFMRLDNELVLLECGEWYQVLKEEMLRRMSEKNDEASKR